ncbi:MAG: carboxylating nicotinate-nucleotide diphosphorylase, partial [Syntrophomonas sp.]
MIYHGLKDLIKRALEEDLGHQDITTANLVSPDHRSRGLFTAKGTGVIAGLDVCGAVFKHLNPTIKFLKDIEEGSQVKPGDAIAQVEGPTLDLLGGERVALNFLQRLSGIATRTRQLSLLIEPYKASLLDTRKTTPGLRVLEKYAVRVGGGRNHRFGLYDGAMIKDNHIKAAGGIGPAVDLLRQRIPHTIKIEVEAE